MSLANESPRIGEGDGTADGAKRAELSESTTGNESSAALGRRQWQLIYGLITLWLVLRVGYAFQFRFDTDEPQHLHVVWGWTHGLLQYRDVFDNHGAVFHLLYAPLLRLLGERADILIPMRLAMLPLVAVSLWCVYRIGANVFSRKVGIWAAIFTAFYPEFFFTSSEFRTDNLWTALWMLSLMLATGRELRPVRAFMIGLLLGAAFGVTVKTGLMIGAISLGAGVILGRGWMLGHRVSWRKVFACAFVAPLGFAIVPSALAAFFASQGAFKEFLYCNVTHNLVPHAQNWKHFDAHLLWFPVFAVIAAAALIRLGGRHSSLAAQRRIFLALVAGSYFTALKSFFPTLSRQDDLPFIPLMTLLATALLPVVRDFAVARWNAAKQRRAGASSVEQLSPRLVWVAPAIVLLEIVFMQVSAPIWKNRTREDIAMVAAVLRATNPDDYVMDATGETMFRRRPYYFALEAFTKARIEQGSIKDDIVEKLVSTGTTVVRLEGLTRSARDFVHDNYISVGHGLFALGKILKFPKGLPPGSPIPFQVVVPGRYSIVGSEFDLTGALLDGEPFAGSRLLDARTHSLQSSAIAGQHITFFATEEAHRNLSALGR